MRAQVYYSVYEVGKRSGMNTAHVRFGEAAFHNRDGLDLSQALRIQALERSLLRQAAALFAAGKHAEAIEMFEGVSTQTVRSAIYGEIYSAAAQQGISTNHSDFGRAAFHRIEGFDVPSELRCQAIQSYLAKTLN